MKARLLSRISSLPAPLRAAALYAIGIGWGKGLGLLLVPLLTARLAPAEFGRLELLSSFAEIGALILGAGVVETLFRFANAGSPEGRRAAADVYGLTLAISAVGLGLAIALSPWAAGMIPLRTGSDEMLLLGLAIALEGAISVPLGWLRMQDRPVAYVLLTCGKATLQVAAVAVLIWSGYGVWGVLAGGLLSAAAISLALGASMLRDRAVAFRPAAWGSLLAYGLPLVVAGLASFVLGTADRWFLADAAKGSAQAATSLGHYALAAKFASISSLLIMAYEMWWVPRRMATLKGGDGRARSARFADAGAAVALLATGLTSAVAPYAIVQLTPVAYQGATALVPWIAGCLCLQAFTTLVNVGVYSGRTGWMPLAVNVASAAVALAGYLLLIPDHGVWGAVWATLAAQTFRFALSAAVSLWRERVPHRWGVILAVAVPSLGAAASPQIIDSPVKGLLVGLALLAFAVVLAVLFDLLPMPGRPGGGARPKWKPRTSALGDVAVAVPFIALIAAAVKFTWMPEAMLAIAVLPLAVYFILRQPFFICTLFIAFSYFRLHEAIPILTPLKLPVLLAVASLAALCAYVLTERRKLAWSPELKLFCILFAITTVGVFTATGADIAMDYWKDSWIKIGLMVFAIATLARSPADFGLACRVFATVGAVVAIVAARNWFAAVEGVTVVEGTRAVISRETRSILGDPNDLSLVLVFPLAHALALAVTPCIGFFTRLQGAVCFALIGFGVSCTQSRGGLLGSIAVIAALLGQRIKSRAVIIGIAVLSFTLLMALAGLRGGGGDGGPDESSMGRIAAWKAAVRMAAAYPLTGVGLNNFRANFFFYTDHWEGLAKAVHSTWFAVLAEAGPIGLVIFVMLFVRAFRNSLRASNALSPKTAGAAYDPRSFAMAQALLCGLVGFAVSGTFLTQAFTWPFWITLSLSIALARHAGERANLPAAAGQRQPSIRLPAAAPARP